MERQNVKRWPYLVIGAVSMLFAGIIYAWSILKAPLAAEFGWDASQLAMNFTLTLCFFCLGGVLSSQITKRTSPKVTIFLAALLVALGFFLCSRLSGGIGMLYLSYGVLAGLGIGMVYNAVISAVSAWYPDKKGFCSGVLMMSFGISSLVLGKAADAMFVLPGFGWRKTYLVMGLTIAVVLAVCGLFIKAPDKSAVLPKAAAKQAGTETKSYTTAEMLKRSSFWKFFLYSVLTSAVGSTVISFARDLALSVGATAALATTLVGVLSLCNGLGRILCGVVFDALGRKKTMLLSNLLAIIAPAVVLLAVMGKSLPLCVAGLCCTGVCYGCSPTISSAFVGEFYGPKSFPTNYSVANLMLIPCSFASTLGNTLLISTGSFAGPFIMLLAFAAAAMALNVSIRKA